MRNNKPITRVCHICGKQFQSWFSREWYCPECKEEAARQRAERSNEAAKRRRKKPVQLVEKPKEYMSVGQYNAWMRKKGLTYGGNPILNCHPLTPKFLQNARTRWTKTDSGWVCVERKGRKK